MLKDKRKEDEKQAKAGESGKATGEVPVARAES